jgi:hypothetical protein
VFFLDDFLHSLPF